MTARIESVTGLDPLKHPPSKLVRHGASLRRRDDQKIETMKKILAMMLNGESLPGVLMHIMRFVTPSKNKQLKKLLLVYWEIVPKTDQNGKLKQEMILVCNALRNDLIHPNEFVRGMTLRFLCKVKEAELLEPLVPSVRACLEHRYPYVRRNAILAIFAMHRTHDFLIPDAAELIANYLPNESDAGCRRAGFLALMNTDASKALQWLQTVWQQIPIFDENLQLAVIEFVRKDCRTPGADKGKYIQAILNLLTAQSAAVKYEAAGTLVTLTSHASAVKAAASCYIDLALREADNNVKLIVLDRISELRQRYDNVLDELVMDILRVLGSPDIEVRRKCIRIAMEMVSTRNVDEVVQILKKELIKTHDQEYEKNNEYRQLLIQAIHSCAIKFHEVAANVVHVLMEFLADSSNTSAVDVVAFVREVMEKYPNLRKSIVERLLQTFADIKAGRVFRGALWILGEYALDATSIDESFKVIRGTLGEVPLLAAEQVGEEKPPANDDRERRSTASPTLASPVAQPTASSARRILADGTYATESAFSSSAKTGREDKKSKPPLRTLIVNGDYFLGSVLATTLTKMVLRYPSLGADRWKENALRAEAMLIMTSIVRIGRSDVPPAPIDEDSIDRILLCLRTLSTQRPNDGEIGGYFLREGRKAFGMLVEADAKKQQEKKSKEKKANNSEVDDVIAFRLLKSKKGLSEGAGEYDLDLTKATGLSERDDYISRLSRVVQLTGFSDPVYAEAYVNVHQYDILLDILIVNQTTETLQNLTLEFSTLGDLKLVERPSPYTVPPRGFHSIKANIKVSSTETGVIFGNIVYDGPGALDTTCVILNDIHIDIMDYINPAKCSEMQFRSMWTEFEWENKVNVNTNITDLKEYLSHIMRSTNMACLTPDHALSGECGFLAANLYAKSIFGEDALANICLEKHGEHITGHIRIRSKTQGMALSLGDKITLSQKTPQKEGIASA
ncbi:Coatomer, beta subunit [Gonapodya prolifera JEL478]|uniref:Coatomer subunit beta n=1 Tax=Gonapodya prolifera (strain JEL478) TaxID=1344416 RepID=A0A139ATL3_GONPJ|nr:Coatomer, beta subunit [Gonapodya prolifera JEL478]|eukprot:KXS20068.1 Coatomer, beta subunit [Gonapodya prolifera JEL478]